MFKKILSTFGIKVVIAILNLLIVIVLSHFIGAGGKGEASLIVMSVTMVILFSNLLGGPTLIYLVPRYNLFLLFFLSSVWSLLTSVLAFIVLQFFGGIPPQMILHISLLSFASAFLSTNLTIILAKEKIMLYNLISLLQTAATCFILYIWFIVQGAPDVYAYVYSMYAAMALCIVISTAYLFPYLKNRSLQNVGKFSVAFLKIGFTNQLSQIIKFVSFRLGYYLLVTYAGTAVLGVYSNGTSLIESLLLISNSFVAILYPKVSNSMNKRYAQLLTQQMTKMSISFCILALIPLLLIPTGFWVWLFGPEFTGVRWVIILLSPGIVFYNISIVINHYYSGLGKYRISAVAYFWGLLVVAILSALVVPNYGLKEAGIITTICYMTTAVFYVIYFSKDAGIKVHQLLPLPADIPWLLKRVKGLLGKIS